MIGVMRVAFKGHGGLLPALKHLSGRYAGRLVFCAIVSKTTCAVAAVATVILDYGVSVAGRRGTNPAELYVIGLLVDRQADSLVQSDVCLVLVPAEQMAGALEILLADLVLVSIDSAHRLVGPIVKHVAVGTDTAVLVAVATDVDSLALALAFITDGALALIVVLAVASRVLVLPNSHRLLAKGLLLSFFDLGRPVVYTNRFKKVTYRTC